MFLLLIVLGLVASTKFHMPQGVFSNDNEFLYTVFDGTYLSCIFNGTYLFFIEQNNHRRFIGRDSFEVFKFTH